MDRNIPAVSLRHRWIRDQRGAALIHVGIAIFVLVGMSAFVLDFGVMWLSRRQAQNAADAGALAGVLSRIYDETGATVPADGLTERAAEQAAQANLVFGVAPGVVATFSDATVPTDPVCPPYNLGGKCVRVDVFRDGTNGSAALPTYFANLFGASSQKVRATATAKAMTANASRCMKPWMVPDQWEENSSPPNNTFDPGVDVYNSSTAYSLLDKGDPITLNPGDPHDAISPGFFYEMDLTGEGSATPQYKDEIVNCPPVLKAIGMTIETLPGRRPGPTADAVQDLINLWPDAEVDAYGNVTGCPGLCGRIGYIAMFDPSEFATADRTSGIIDLEIVNIMAVFIESVVTTGPDKGRVNGILVGGPGEIVSGPEPPNGAGFLQAPLLVR